MRAVMVRYQVASDRVAENVALVRAVFRELEEARPERLRYATFQLPDGVSFVHLAMIETSDGKNPLTALAAFRAFSERIADRCEVPPQASELSLVGAFGLPA